MGVCKRASSSYGVTPYYEPSCAEATPVGESVPRRAGLVSFGGVHTAFGTGARTVLAWVRYPRRARKPHNFREYPLEACRGKGCGGTPANHGVQNQLRMLRGSNRLAMVKRNGEEEDGQQSRVKESQGGRPKARITSVSQHAHRHNSWHWHWHTITITRANTC